MCQHHNYVELGKEPMSITGLLFLGFHNLSDLALVRKFVKNPVAVFEIMGWVIELSRNPTGASWDPIILASLKPSLLLIAAGLLQGHPRMSK